MSLNTLYKEISQFLYLTGMSKDECSKLDTSHFKGWIYVSDVDTAETIRFLRNKYPCKGYHLYRSNLC
jgi:hypothetical protein